jgi:regulatory protein
MKIIQALRMKQLSSEAITGGIAEIDEEEYRAILQKLLQQKARSISARNDYERNAKLIRFACGKGFLMEEILSLLPQTDGNEYPCDHEAMD